MNHNNNLIRDKIGILLANTGTPESPTPQAIRAFLSEFLADRRLIQLPRWLWLPILHLIILNIRPKRSARIYRQIWGKNGSPLLKISQKQAQKLRQEREQSQLYPGIKRSRLSYPSTG
jgi:ferrochelatase